MTFDELIKTDWYLTRPKRVKDAINKLPPTNLYRFKDSKKQCYIVSYEEPHSETEPITVTVQKTGVGGNLALMGLGVLDTNKVFDVSLDNLEKWTDD
jgi:hypothetical protein